MAEDPPKEGGVIVENLHDDAPTTSEGLKEALLTVLLDVLTWARFLIPVTNDLEASHIRLSCISHMAPHLSASTSMLQVGQSFTSYRSVFCCSLGYPSLTN